jgi:hypothetical protein
VVFFSYLFNPVDRIFFSYIKYVSSAIINLGLSFHNCHDGNFCISIFQINPTVMGEKTILKVEADRNDI